MNKEGYIKMMCIKSYGNCLIKYNIYECDIKNQLILQKITSYGRELLRFKEFNKYFISLAEWREQQINTILE